MKEREIYKGISRENKTEGVTKNKKEVEAETGWNIKRIFGQNKKEQ